MDWEGKREKEKEEIRWKYTEGEKIKKMYRCEWREEGNVVQRGKERERESRINEREYEEQNGELECECVNVNE